MEIVLLIVLATASLVVGLIMILRMRRRKNALENFDGSQDPYLSLVHVQPDRVSMAIDAYRGPTDLTALPDASAALSPLSKYKGLYLFEDAKCRTNGLCVSDAAVLAHSIDSGKLAKLPLLIAPLSSYPQGQRSLFLLAPFDPTSGNPPSLGRLAKESGRPIRVFCASELESSLFEIAWAIAGGGDVSDASQLTVEVVSGPAAAAKAASTLVGSSAVSIVPVWSCPGSQAQKIVIESWPSGHAACVSYHPADDETADGFLVESAPHAIKARAPALTASPVSIIPGTRPTVNIPSKTQTVLAAPSLVVLYSEDKNQDGEDTVRSMADAISDALLKNADADPETTIALCTFYEAQGIPLLPRTEQTVRAFEGKRQTVAFESPYSRPSVPVMEQFRTNRFEKQALTERNFAHLKRTDEWGSDLESAPPVELVPTTPVRLAIESHEGYDEARLAPRGSVSVDGVRLRTGDRVIFESQESTTENGSWIVVKTVGPDGIPLLQKPVALDPASGYQTKLERSASISPMIEAEWQWRFSLPTTEPPASLLREGDRVAWLPLPGTPTGIVTSVGRPTAVTAGIGITSVIEIVVPARSVVASPQAAALEDEWFDPLSRCLDADAIGNTLDTRQACERKYGIGSGPETTGAYTWDRPCTKDRDCPYLQNGTEDRRGTCLKSGRCEEPVGVKPFAYRKIAWDDGLVCACPKNDAKNEDGIRLSLRSASRECCNLPGATPVFNLQSV